MSSITLNVADIFPAGTSVAAYPRSNWYGDTRPSGTPQGSSAATATVAADGTLTFASLTDGVPYFAYAQVSGVDKYRRFMPSTSPSSAGSTVVDGDDALGQFEGQPISAWGHSWVAVDTNATSGQRWFQRLASRLRSGTVSINGFSGKSIATVTMNALGGSSPFAVRTKALVLAVCSINDISLYGTTPTPMLAGYQHAWRAFLSIVTANAKVAANTDNFAYSSGFALETITPTADQTATGGARWKTSTVGEYCDFTFTGTQCDLFLVAKTAGAGLATITEGGTTLGTLDLTAAVSQETPAIFKIRGLAAGNHTIRVTLTSGASLTVDSYRIPLATAPPVLVLAEPLVNWDDKTFGTASGQSMLTNTLKPALQTIVAEYPTALYVDGQTSEWSEASLKFDTRHPNDAGCSYLAKIALRALKNASYLPGLDVLGISAATYDATYSAPAGPSVPGGGYAGSAGGPAAPGDPSGTTYTVTDAFTRADASTLGTTETGSKTWTVAGTSAVWSVVSNRAKQTAGSGNGNALIDFAAADHTVKATVGSLGGTASTDVGGVVARAADENNYYIATYRQSSTVRGYTLGKRVAGTLTNLVTTSQVPVVGDTVLVQCKGNIISMYINGTLAAQVTDTSLPTNTKAGLYGNFPSGPGVSEDNFAVGASV